MNDLVVYIHGKGGSAAESEHYAPLFPDWEVLGLDYRGSVPWEAGPEIREALERLRGQYGSVTLIANSIGAFYCLHAGIGGMLQNAYFISPIVDMEGLILSMLAAEGVTEEELRARCVIPAASGEELSWEYLRYVREHPVDWAVPTRILFGRGDTLTDYGTVAAFARTHGASLTVMEEGEHWFHTPEQLRFLDGWISEHTGDVFSVNGTPCRVLRFLGRGKGGYSYLAERGGRPVVLKQIHHEPCDYYAFGDKIRAELHDYERLRSAGIPVPTMLDIDIPAERIVKEYAAGPTVAELLRAGVPADPYLPQVREMAARARAAGLNIDYYPANFVPDGDRLLYVDYECNSYAEQWDFEHWGLPYWQPAALRPYREEDYRSVCDFLIELNRPDRGHINWNWARFEWMMEHPEFDRSAKGSIGLWKVGDRVVGAAIYDMYFGEAFCAALPDYESLYPEILDYACRELSDGDGLGIAIRDGNGKELAAVRSAGFVPAEPRETVLRLDLDGLAAAPPPEGYTIAELDPGEDIAAFQWLVWQGFDHGSDRAEFERQEPAEARRRPHFDPRLSLAARAPDGELVSYCCLWYRPDTDYAYVEPVCTVPAHRGKGLASALLTEALGRAKAMGAGEAFVISDLAFFRDLGFSEVGRFSFYWNREHKR